MPYLILSALDECIGSVSPSTFYYVFPGGSHMGPPHSHQSVLLPLLQTPSVSPLSDLQRTHSHFDILEVQEKTTSNKQRCVCLNALT